MTPLKVIIWFIALGVVFLILGIVFLVNNNSLLHIEHYYHGEDVDYQDSFQFTLKEDFSEPIYVYYTLSSFYQNHAKFVKEKDLKEKSVFNDTFTISYNGNTIALDTENITTTYDDKREGWDELTPQQRVWYKIAPLPTFRKLYAVIHEDLKKGVYTVSVDNKYRPMPEMSKKAFLIATTSWMGGYSPWTQYVYIITGGVCIILGLVFILIFLLCPRQVGQYHEKFGSDIADTSILSDAGSSEVISIPEHLLTTDAFAASLSSSSTNPPQ